MRHEDDLGNLLGVAMGVMIGAIVVIGVTVVAAIFF